MAQYVPLEVLGEIFVLCLEENLIQPNPQVPPLLLCHVCRSWRRAAFGTPQLWRELTMVLKFASAGSYLGCGFLQQEFEAFELWNACRGDERKFVPIITLVRSQAVSDAEALTLSNFSLQDHRTISMTLKGVKFNNLQYLSIAPPVDQEYNTRTLQFPPCPTLRRLHFDCDAAISSSPGIVTAFCWGTLTHFSAKLELQPRDWYIILEQCVNLSFGIFDLRKPEGRQLITSHRGTYYHLNLKTLGIRGDPDYLQLAVDKFTFPSLIALHISCTLWPVSVETVHALLNTTPSLKELRLQSCIPFHSLNSPRQPQNSFLTGSLSKFVPHLQTLVVDPGQWIISRSLLSFLHSSWLNDAWSPLSTQRSVEFILYEDQDLTTLLRNRMDPSVSMNFRVSARHIPRPIWKRPTATYLRDRWDDLFAFYDRD